MSDILNTINHTTLEALCFKHACRNLTDTYFLGPLTVYLHNDGSMAMALHDRATELTFEQIKELAKAHRLPLFV